MSKPYTICIVDDDVIYNFTMKRTIEQHQLAKKVLSFSDGEEAINFLIENVANSADLPDVIFLDIFMPIMDGFQFMEEYVKLKPKIAKKIFIFMVTSSVNDIDSERAQRISELSNYIVKPVLRGEVKIIIQDLEDQGLLKSV